MLSSAAICNDLEILLETGYAQLNQSRVEFDAANEEEVNFSIIDSQVMEQSPNQSPFPKGMTIYDGESDDNNDQSDEVEGGYEVICSREV